MAAEVYQIGYYLSFKKFKKWVKFKYSDKWKEEGYALNTHTQSNLPSYICLFFYVRPKWRKNNWAEENIYLSSLIKYGLQGFITWSEENLWEWDAVRARESSGSFPDLVMSDKGKQSVLLMVRVQHLLVFNLFELCLVVWYQLSYPITFWCIFQQTLKRL